MHAFTIAVTALSLLPALISAHPAAAGITPAPGSTSSGACPASATVTAGNQFICPRIQCTDPVICPQFIVESFPPCSCLTKPVTTTTVPYFCSDCKFCSIPTHYNFDSCTTTPTTTANPCPASVTVTAGNQFRCPRIQCINTPKCKDHVVVTKLPCSCVGKAPTTTTVPYPCGDCKCPPPRTHTATPKACKTKA